MRTILSLCDYSGTWSRPYLDLGYNVIRVDPKLTTGVMSDGGYAYGMTAHEFLKKLPAMTYIGVLAAPPCTDFSGSGARWWAEKDMDGRTLKSTKIVHDCLQIIERVKPEFWALENPVGRLQKLVPQIGDRKMLFHPWEYAGWATDPANEAYTKKTILWGNFNTELERNQVEPIMYESAGKRGSKLWYSYGGSSERTKEARSKTPEGFSIAFSKANSGVLRIVA